MINIRKIKESVYKADKTMFVDSKYQPTSSRDSTVEITEDLWNQILKEIMILMYMNRGQHFFKSK